MRDRKPAKRRREAIVRRSYSFSDGSVAGLRVSSGSNPLVIGTTTGSVVSRQAGGPVRGTGRFWERTWVSRCCTIPVDLSAIDGMDEVTAHIVLTEVGPDFSAFGSASEFCSWLRLCPNNKVSGGRILARQTRKGKPRLALAQRTAAQTLHASQSPMGEYFRRMRAKFGPAKAITAAAHKMARVIFHMVTTKQAYDDSILAKQDAQQRQKREAKIRRQAREIGYQLTPLQAA